MFCSLIARKPQVILPGTWQALRFDEVSADSNRWHATKDLDDEDSALIIPRMNGVGWLSALVFWEDSDATQVLHRFTRDPYVAPDSTCTNDRATTPGAEFHTYSWPMVLRTGQPVAAMVSHNASRPIAVTLAEFKAWMP